MPQDLQDKRDQELFAESEAWMEIGYPEESVLCLNEISEVAQDEFDLLRLRWNAYFLLKRYDELKKTGKLLTELYTRRVQSWLLYAQSYHVTGEYEKSLNILKSVEKQFSTHWDFAYDYACYHALLGDFTSTDHWLEIAMKQGNPKEIKRLINMDSDLKKYRDYLKGNNL